jgi:hypothetical protein
MLLLLLPAAQVLCPDAQYNKLKFATTRKKSHYKTVLMQTKRHFMQTESAFMQTESAIC